MNSLFLQHEFIITSCKYYSITSQELIPNQKIQARTFINKKKKSIMQETDCCCGWGKKLPASLLSYGITLKYVPEKPQ